MRRHNNGRRLCEVMDPIHSYRRTLLCPRLVKSSAGKSRRSFFHERSRCFLMILGAAGLDLAAGLQIEKLGE